MNIFRKIKKVLRFLFSGFKIHGKYTIKTYKAGTRELLRETGPIHNLIVLGANTGLYLVLNALLGVNTYPLEVTLASIGSGDTPPAASDTDLETPVLEDIVIAQKQRIANDEIMFTFFVSDAELADGDYKEFGVFCGTQLFARSIISPTYSKATGEDTQVDYTFTISAS